MASLDALEAEEDCKPLILNVLTVAAMLAEQGLEPWPSIRKRDLAADFIYPHMVFYIIGLPPLRIAEGLLLQYSPSEAAVVILHQIEKLWEQRMRIVG